MITCSLKSFYILLLILFPSYLSDPDFSKAYDARQYYPECTSLQKPLNQGSCGSCWAFSTTGVSSDMLCIQGYSTEYMAPEHSIQCDTQNNGCNGGYISKAFQFHVNSGLVPQTCKMYLGTSARRCSTECDDGGSVSSVIYKMQNVTRIYKRNDKAGTAQLIMDAIKKNGPVAASYRVYQEFQDFYSSSSNAKKIYSVETTAGMNFLTYHAVKIIGWGTNSNGDPYWLIQNSWGSNWADGGYFRLSAKIDGGSANGYEGELDILGDVYQPWIEPYVDPCSDFYRCQECLEQTGKSSSRVNKARKNSATNAESGMQSSILKKVYERTGMGPEENDAPNADEENPRCGYCRTTDRCVSVKADGTPERGTCEEMVFKSADTQSTRKNAEEGGEESGGAETPEGGEESETTESSDEILCPLDDCVPYSSDPVKCLDHKGCKYCVQTNKCRKGSNGQMNTGTCLDSINSRAELIQNYSCFLQTNERLCVNDESCTWCTPPSGSTDTARCYPVFAGASETKPKIGRCVGCTCKVKKDFSNFPTGSSTTDVEQETDICRTLTCDMCGTSPNSPCAWCYTTESCIPADKVESECSISSLNEALTQKLGTVGAIPLASNKLTRCSKCLNYSSCSDCANDPQCGWYKQAAICMPGIVKDNLSGLLNKDYPNDQFIINKLRCPAVIIDDSDDSSSSSSASSHSGLYLAMAAVGTAILRLMM